MDTIPIPGPSNTGVTSQPGEVESVPPDKSAESTGMTGSEFAEDQNSYTGVLVDSGTPAAVTNPKPHWSNRKKAIFIAIPVLVLLSICAISSIVVYNKAIALFYYGSGVTAYKNGDLDLAINKYDQAIKLNPHLARAYNNRGLVYDSKGDFNRAISDYDQAIQLDRRNAVMYNNRANSYYHQGDWDRAISDYVQAIQLDPAYAMAYYDRGLAYYKKGDLESAVRDYNQSLQLDPNYADAYFLSRACLCRLG
jgi:tetratricopeptide (TPR) repeat protein